MEPSLTSSTSGLFIIDLSQDCAMCDDKEMSYASPYRLPHFWKLSFIRIGIKDIHSAGSI